MSKPAMNYSFPGISLYDNNNTNKNKNDNEDRHTQTHTHIHTHTHTHTQSFKPYAEVSNVGNFREDGFSGKRGI